MKIQDFRELEVYNRSFALQQEVFAASKSFPSEEKYSLTDQARRSSRSVGANIAEAWKKRRYVAHFSSKLTDADGELSETIHWILTARACEYLTHSQALELVSRCEEVGRMLGVMIRDADSWCIT